MVAGFAVATTVERVGVERVGEDALDEDALDESMATRGSSITEKSNLPFQAVGARSAE